MHWMIPSLPPDVLEEPLPPPDPAPDELPGADPPDPTSLDVLASLDEPPVEDVVVSSPPQANRARQRTKEQTIRMAGP